MNLLDNLENDSGYVRNMGRFRAQNVLRSGTAVPKSAPCKNDLPAEKIRELLDYDPDTGVLRWKVGLLSGRMAGTKNDRGYILVNIQGRNYRAHRLAWVLTYGRWPELNLDHINGQREDNRITNLRECDQVGNMQNTHKRKRSKYGPGVNYDPIKNRFKAHITVNRKHIFLGNFKTAEAASEAYWEAKTRLHPHASPSAIEAQQAVSKPQAVAAAVKAARKRHDENEVLKRALVIMRKRGIDCLRVKPLPRRALNAGVRHG